MKLYGIDEEKDINKEVGEKTELTTLGLTLPGNVLIIGTVNMDDTTHQFSRKVIDRAMTIEMNGGNLSAMFGGSKNLEYLENPNEPQYINILIIKASDYFDVLEKKLGIDLKHLMD